jgi:hypothetical protein
MKSLLPYYYRNLCATAEAQVLSLWSSGLRPDSYRDSVAKKDLKLRHY